MRAPYQPSIDASHSFQAYVSTLYAGVQMRLEGNGQFLVDMTPNEATELAAKLLHAADKHGKESQRDVCTVARRLAKKYAKEQQ